MAVRTINVEAGRPSLDEARRFLLAQMQAAAQDGIRILKVIHGYGSSGAGGVLCAGIRKSLRLRVKEGKALVIIPGERFSSDFVETRDLLARRPELRRDRDLNRANPGITLVELAADS
jgi:hypothetical protein